jgi:hypothetical protein
VRARIGLAAALLGLLGAWPEEARATSCAFIVKWKGEVYDAVGVQVSPLPGRRLGRGFSPGCPRGGSWIPLAELPGASPREALVMLDWDSAVLVRRSLLKHGHVPSAVKALRTPPRCENPGRVKLFGEWLGINGPGGTTERDLKPPYRLQIHVGKASDPRYLRAFLRIDVTSRTKNRLTRRDVEEGLWRGGDMGATVRCARGRYVAIWLFPRPSWSQPLVPN